MNTTEAEQKPTLLQQMGGVSGLIYASIPSIVFVAADAAADYTWRWRWRWGPGRASRCCAWSARSPSSPRCRVCWGRDRRLHRLPDR